MATYSIRLPGVGPSNLYFNRAGDAETLYGLRSIVSQWVLVINPPCLPSPQTQCGPSWDSCPCPRAPLGSRMFWPQSLSLLCLSGDPVIPISMWAQAG